MDGKVHVLRMFWAVAASSNAAANPSGSDSVNLTRNYIAISYTNSHVLDIGKRLDKCDQGLDLIHICWEDSNNVVAIYKLIDKYT